MRIKPLIGLTALALGACATGNPHRTETAINPSVREQGKYLVTDICVQRSPMEEDESALDAAGRFEAYFQSRYSPGKESQRVSAGGTLTGLTIDTVLRHDEEQFCARYRVDK